MAIITPGTNSTFNGNTAEQQLIEAFVYLQQYEAREDINPNKLDYVQGSFNINNLMFIGSFDIPCTQLINSQGQIVYTATEYLQIGTFSPGSPKGTFKSDTLMSYFIEVLTYCQILEQNTIANPQQKDYINANFNTDRNTFSGSITLPFLITTNSNSAAISIVSQAYLGTAS